MKMHICDYLCTYLEVLESMCQVGTYLSTGIPITQLVGKCIKYLYSHVPRILFVSLHVVFCLNERICMFGQEHSSMELAWNSTRKLVRIETTHLLFSPASLET